MHLFTGEVDLWHYILTLFAAYNYTLRYILTETAQDFRASHNAVLQSDDALHLEKLNKYQIKIDLITLVIAPGLQ